jgi:hypothetical protein
VKTKCCFEAEVATIIGSSRVEHGLNRSGAKRAMCVLARVRVRAVRARDAEGVQNAK